MDVRAIFNSAFGNREGAIAPSAALTTLVAITGRLLLRVRCVEPTCLQTADMSVENVASQCLMPKRRTARNGNQLLFGAGILRGRRAVVAPLTALLLPVYLGVMALGIDESYWLVLRIRCQAIADAAAMAGGERYAGSGSASVAVTTAANVAELNGVTPGSRTGTGTAGITDDSSSWTTSFSFDPGSNQLTATVQTSASIIFGRIFTAASSIGIGATAVSQVTQRNAGQLACVVALNGDTSGVTTDVDVTISGSTSVNSPNCGLRSNGEITLSGSSSIDVSNLYASGGVNQAGSSSVSCPNGAANCTWATAPQVADPLASTYGSALNIPPGTTQDQGSGTTLSPGLYSSLSFSGSGTYTLEPGIYYVTGAVSFGGSVTISGTGVTLISGGGIGFGGNATVNLSAPTSGATAGLLYGSSSPNATVSWRGTSNNTLNGIIYAPNALVSYIGDSQISASNDSCTEVVASTVKFLGNSSLSNTGCAGSGIPLLYMLPSWVQLVQ